jgi:hypothetical protein
MEAKRSEKKNTEAKQSERKITEAKKSKKKNTEVQQSEKKSTEAKRKIWEAKSEKIDANFRLNMRTGSEKKPVSL